LGNPNKKCAVNGQHLLRADQRESKLVPDVKLIV